MKRVREIAAAVAVGATAAAGLAVTAWHASAAAAPQEQPIPGQSQRLIIGYKAGTAEAGSDTAAARDAGAKLAAKGLNATLQRRLGIGAALVDVGRAVDERTLTTLMEVFRADPDVAYVEPDGRMYALAEPNDPEYVKQWHYFEDKAGMRVPGAWSSSTGSGVTVAVIDTGITQHSDLSDRIVAGYDFISESQYARDNNGRDGNPADEGDWNTYDNECFQGSRKYSSTWHGTHVAGTIGASTNNGKGVAGVAYDAKIQPVRVLGKCGTTWSDLADAIVWSSGGTVSGIPANQTPAKVINMSIGGGGSCPSSLQSAIDGAVQRGSTVVVAAGNSNQNVSNSAPANCNNVIAVAASDRDGNKADYSNYGSIIDIAAPGGEVNPTASNGVLSTLNSGTTTPGSESYAYYNGTSMAAPHVAGVAALALAKTGDLTPAQVEKLIKDNSRPLPGSCGGGCGAGLADATKTLQALGGGSGNTITVTNPGDQTTKVGDSVSLQIKASDSNPNETLTYSAGGLPAGVSINSSTGLISGKPTTAGTSTVTVTVTDSTKASGSTTFKWNVTSDSGGATVTVTNPGDQWAFRGWAIQPLQIRATDSNGLPLTFTASGLPAGLSISSSGLITGTPTASGNFTVTVTATDSEGAKGSTTFRWAVY